MYNLGVHGTFAGCACVCGGAALQGEPGLVAQAAWIPIILGGFMISSNAIGLIKLRWGEWIYRRLKDELQ
jgi:hypothetical protein